MKQSLPSLPKQPKKRKREIKLTKVDLGKYTEREVRAFWDKMVKKATTTWEGDYDPYVIFHLKKTLFAIKATSCKGVHPFTQPSPLPVLPPHIMGISAIRGRPISVTDLGVFFGMKPTRRRGHFLLVFEEEEETALNVDWVETVKPIDIDNLEKPTAKWEGLRTGLVLGIATSTEEKKPIIVLNAARCLRAAETKTTI